MANRRNNVCKKIFKFVVNKQHLICRMSNKKKINVLRGLRILLAGLFFVMVTLLFLDFTGTIHLWFGWTAKIQFLPALLAMNVLVVVSLLLLTFVFGRIYCSVICPLGVMQDIIGYFGGKAKKNRYSFSTEKKWLRYGVLGIFVVFLVAGIGSIAALLAPYSSYGRIASNLFAPLYRWGNNLLAYFAERADSYTFYETEVWMKGIGTFVVAAVTFVIVAILAWRNGRTYCNTICPVGTLLGLVSRFSLFKMTIDHSKCKECGMCGKNCKASCIDTKNGKIDYSRCVACMDCIGNCSFGAISYSFMPKAGGNETDAVKSNGKTLKEESGNATSKSRRTFIAVTAAMATSSLVKAQEKKVDGGLAAIEDKKIPHRNTPIVPPGALSLRNVAQHCTACQLCISACPNQVLRPSEDFTRFMTPVSSYEKGYCRPECTKCSDVCPAGAIKPIDVAEKSSIQIGHAVWIKENCLPFAEHVACGNCARHCPSGAISMVPLNFGVEGASQETRKVNGRALMIPVIDTERCIGCGACENLCPARPFSAIYVEGHEVHRTI